MAVKNTRKFRLGDLLVMHGRISEDQLGLALDEQKKQHRQLGECLLAMGFVTDDDIAHVLQLQLNIPRIDLRNTRIDTQVLSLINGSVLRKHNVVPVGYSERNPGVIILAMSDPLNMVAQDDISIVTGYMVEPRIATIGEINYILDRYFGTGEAMSAAEQYTRERELQLQQMEEEELAAQADLENAPIVQLVRSIVEQAARQRASDIHIEALEKNVRVRYRIDGSMMEKMLYDIKLMPAISTRIKILSGMDISEKRKPQDGRMSTVIDRVEYDIRVSILPTSYGEKVVMRLASKTGLTKSKAELGMQPDELERFNHILANPNGIILVTGPTGSGKSTTLYTALRELNREDVNIITVEDPVEANIQGINQVQVNVKAELTFASALRSILRQDPDIIMIGEIRDLETASIAIQASITGHLVVSTLHTNSSAATITRLIDMGVESFLIADSVVGVLAQRLVRRLCNSCARTREATVEEKAILGVPESETLEIKEAVGCTRCNDIGFLGRVGIYEIMQMTPELKTIVAKQGTTEQIKNSAVASGMKTLRASAAEYVKMGITTIEEMLKVSFET